MDQTAARAQLRNDMISRRRLLLPQEVEMGSSQVINRLRKLEPIRQARSIMLYSSIKNEVDLAAFLEEQQRMGKTILLPRVKGGHLEAVQFRGWKNCKEGPFAINEPQGPAFPADSIDVILVPGLAFDAKGYRLGYGKGYYDRFLPLCSSQVFLCGVAYEFQVVDTIFPHPNDVPLHWLVTDRSEVAVDMNFF